MENGESICTMGLQAQNTKKKEASHAKQNNQT
jgi:hypothetical protein